MSNHTTGENTPITLTLRPGAFLAAIEPILAGGKIGWNGDDHLEFANRLLEQLTTEDGVPAVFTEKAKARIRLIARPIYATQKPVLDDTMEGAGYKLDAAAEQAICLLFSATQLATYLEKQINPITGKEYIMSGQKRGAKKKGFMALMTKGSPTAPPQAVEDVLNEPEEEIVEEAVAEPEPPKPVAKTTTVKPKAVTTK